MGGAAPGAEVCEHTRAFADVCPCVALRPGGGRVYVWVGAAAGGGHRGRLQPLRSRVPQGSGPGLRGREALAAPVPTQAGVQGGHLAGR